eukprot:gene29641-22904_t
MAVAMTTLLLSVLVAGVAGDVANCKTYAKKTERIKGKDCSCYSSCPSGYTDDGEHTDCSICPFNPLGCDTEWCKRAVDDKTKCSTCNSGYIIKNNKCVRVCTTDAGKCTSQSECDPNLFISEVVEGSSYNKAIELYNPTEEELDLS